MTAKTWPVPKWTADTDLEHGSSSPTSSTKRKKNLFCKNIIRREAEPILKKIMAAVHTRINVAMSAPLTWVKKPKQEMKEEKSFMEEIKAKISQLKPLGLPKPQPHRLPKTPKEPRALKELILRKEKWTKNDRNAANLRLRLQIRQQMMRKEYDELLCQREQKESAKKSAFKKNANENFTNKETRNIWN
ncbi:hypothetical protein AX14_000914 [Amanita brunnescens Koide BX004]|nr:hypothetical protein AX14_000914 [Amanita brunnescens Koide BX004]